MRDPKFSGLQKGNRSGKARANSNRAEAGRSENSRNNPCGNDDEHKWMSIRGWNE